MAPLSCRLKTISFGTWCRFHPRCFLRVVGNWFSFTSKTVTFPSPVATSTDVLESKKRISGETGIFFFYCISRDTFELAQTVKKVEGNGALGHSNNVRSFVGRACEHVPLNAKNGAREKGRWRVGRHVQQVTTQQRFCSRGHERSFPPRHRDTLIHKKKKRNRRKRWGMSRSMFQFWVGENRFVHYVAPVQRCRQSVSVVSSQLHAPSLLFIYLFRTISSLRSFSCFILRPFSVFDYIVDEMSNCIWQLLERKVKIRV